jgi:hypothetical protein
MFKLNLMTENFFGVMFKNLLNCNKIGKNLTLEALIQNKFKNKFSNINQLYFH